MLSEIDVARADRGVAVEPEIPDDLPPAMADRERVHQVLFNLVDNAVRYTPPGGAVTVTAHRLNGSVEVEVHDNGVGHPRRAPSQAVRAVLPGRHLAARGDDGGTGIGLAIARSVVEAHGGHIHADSEPGQGSTFTFELPVAPSPETGGTG